MHPFIKRHISSPFAVVQLFALSGVSCFFALWFKKQQLALISPELPLVYPLFSWLTAIVITFLFFTILWLGWSLLFKPFMLPDDWRRFRLFDALSFTSLLLAPLGLSMPVVTLVFAASKGIMVGYFLFRRAVMWRTFNLTRHLAVLILIIAFCSIFSGFLSPLFWDNPMGNYPLSGTGRILASTVPLYRSAFVNAEQYSFSFLDHSYWAGISRFPTDFFSVVVPLVAFACGLPAVGMESFHRLLLMINFTQLVAGSFFFYLFLLVGLRLSFTASVFGGLALVFTNAVLIRQIVFDYPANTNPFLCLPLVFLFIRLAFRENRPAWAVLSGLVLALPFYLLAPHPEATMKGIFFFGFYLAYLVIFNRELASVQTRVKLVLLCLTAALAGSAYYLMPVIAPILAGEAFVGVSNRPLFTYGLRDVTMVLLPFLASGGILVCLAATELRNIWSRQSLRSDLVFFGSLFLFLFLLLILGSDGIFGGLFSHFLPSIKFYAVERTSLYLGFTALIVAAMALDSLSRMDQKHRASLIFIGIALCCTVASAFVPHDIARKILSLNDFVVHGTSYQAAALSSQSGLLLPYLLPHYGTGGISIIRPFIVVFMSLIFALLCAFPFRRQKKNKTAAVGSHRASYGQIIRMVLMAAVFIVITMALAEPLQSGTSVIYSRYLPGYQPVPVQYNSNPSYAGLRPYVSLQSVLANVQGIRGLNSSKHVRDRLRQFEKDLTSLRLSQVDERVAGYYRALRLRQAAYAADIPLEDVVSFARAVYPVVDAFYLDHFRARYLPLFPSREPPIYWVGDYNTAAIFSGLDNPLYRIMALATDEKSGRIQKGGDAFVGVGEGLLINNATQTLDVRTNINYPGLCVYTIVEMDTTDPVPWHLRAETILNRGARKLMNIAGIDIFALPRSKWSTLEDKADLQLIETHSHQKIDPDFVVVKDLRSHGLAYLANNVTYSPPLNFTLTDFLMEANLIKLGQWLYAATQSKFDAIIEDERRNPGERESLEHKGANSLKALSFIGDMAAFQIENKAGPCKLVFNLAAISGWKAYADAQPLRIRRANFAFMSVDVPPGRHLIWFEHRPASMLGGVFITLLAFLAGLSPFIWTPAAGNFTRSFPQSPEAATAPRTPIQKAMPRPEKARRKSKTKKS